MAVSLALMALQPRPCLLGYSQLCRQLDAVSFVWPDVGRRKTQGNALKIDTIEVVLCHQVRHGLDKGSAVLSRANACGKIPGACPTANGHQGFHILNVMLAANLLGQYADNIRRTFFFAAATNSGTDSGEDLLTSTLPFAVVSLNGKGVSKTG